LSCISTKEINEKWNGKTITELKIYFGEPSIIIEKENNDKEFIYKKKRNDHLVLVKENSYI
jgi:hypothetical protein